FTAGGILGQRQFSPASHRSSDIQILSLQLERAEVTQRPPPPSPKLQLQLLE
ncbi:hypothetical protein AMECASPLE_004353, partial [Ameca splendens]